MNESTILPQIAKPVSPGEAPSDGRPWQRALREAVRDPRELCRLLELPAEYEAAAVRAAESFGLFAPRGYVARMRTGDPYDPLLRQVLPLGEELTETPGYGADPVDDTAAALRAGLLQKYHGRALMVTTGACAVHCRYCFRRHYPYSEGPHSLAEWEPALAHLSADITIEEVLLSGGDPLTLVDSWLARLAERLASIRHLRRLRVHTRLPIVIPERVCGELIDWLCGTRLTPIMVVHANHPAEISDSVAAALARLVDAGIPVLNQAVLLRGVNDSADALAELCRRLVDLRVMPYYLHQLDQVQGAAHFEVPEKTGRRLIAELRRRLPGYAVPRYVRETAGKASKSLLA
ncbi:MAG TPA: EF-P beta-lysylation protein EpmB [Pirellulales bacterium]|nr:EF-P beta-lysylation protein EpmB [Pirellulales bacterium]